jgi:hypothetical protein
MKSRFGYSIVFACLVLFPTVSLQAAEVRDELAQIVRSMGYGGGIHNFKNYVLRDREEYRTAARADFSRILDVIAGLERGDQLNAAEQQALKAVKAVVESYAAALDRITELRNKAWRAEDIDRVVIIDDTAAVQGLDTLRARWSWTDLEEIEFQLGYGKAIHNFKNYVLRGRQEYHTEALQNLLTVEALVADLLGQPELKDPQAAAQKLVTATDTVVHDRAIQEITRLFRENRAALENVERTARAYRDHLDLVERLIITQRSVRQIDLAVKINDGPAKAGLAHLKEGLVQLSGQHASITAQPSKP